METPSRWKVALMGLLLAVIAWSLIFVLAGCAPQSCWLARNTGYYCPKDYLGKE